MLLVQQYLKTHSFADLVKEHGVYASFSKQGYKWSLNYDQLEAKEDDPLAQECRGLILATVDGHSLTSQAQEIDGKLKYDNICPGETTVLAFPMKRFFNHGQGAAADIDWSDPNLSILEKLDGTLTILYYDRFAGQWHVATRSVSEADCLLDSGFYTFRTLFEKALKDMNGITFEEFTKDLPRSLTYCFELTSPYNRIVVSYPDTRITLLAVRENIPPYCECNLSKLDPNVDIGIPHVHAHAFTNVADLLSWVSTQNPLEHEGVVALDSQFRRLKIKNASYVAFNRARDILGTSERNCLELVLAGKEDDVIPALPPEIVERILSIKAGLTSMIRSYDEAYSLIKGAADQINKGDKKTFALIVKSHKDLWSAPMFQMFDGKSANMKDFLEKNRKEGTWADSFLDKILSIVKSK